MRSCSGSCLKYLLFAFNIIFFIFSIVIIVFGALSIVAVNSDKEYAPFRPFAILIVVGGSILFVTTFLACCGAVSENRCMLITYAVLESILALLNIVLLILIYAITFEWNDYVENGERSVINRDTIPIILGTTAAVEIIGIVLASFMAANIRAERHRI